MCGSSAASERKPSTNVPYTSSVSRIRSGRFVRTSSAIFCMVRGRMATDAGLLGLTTKKAFTFGSASFSISASGYCQVCRPSAAISLCASSTVLKPNSSSCGISR